MRKQSHGPMSTVHGLAGVYPCLGPVWKQRLLGMQNFGPILFQCSYPFEVQSWSCLSAGWSCRLFDSLCALPLLVRRLCLLCKCWLRLCWHVHWADHRPGDIATWFAMLHVLLRLLQGLTVNKAEARCRWQLDSSFCSGLNTQYCFFKKALMHTSVFTAGACVASA